MSVANIASLAVAKETCNPYQLAKVAIFATDMLWESCSKFYFELFLFKMCYKNIISLEDIKNIQLYIDIYKNQYHEFFLYLHK